MSNNKNHTIVANLLVRRFLDLLSGNNERMLFGRKPSDVAMLGMIKADVAQTNSSGERVFTNSDKKFESVPSIGLSFLVDQETKIVQISLKGRLYYRKKPTFSDQIAFILDKRSRETGVAMDDVNALMDYYNQRADRDPDFVFPNEEIMFLYGSIELEEVCPKFQFDLDDFPNSLAKANAAIMKALQDRCSELETESFFFKRTERPLPEWIDHNSFDSIVNANATPIKPNWNICLAGNAIPDENGSKKTVTLQIINATNPISLKDSYETTLYNAGLTVESSQAFCPIELNALKHDYLRPAMIYGVGINCALDYEDPRCLKTTNAPAFLQYRVKPKQEYDAYVTFSGLLNDPIGNLKSILNGLRKAIAELQTELAEEGPIMPEAYINRFSEELFNLECEADRFAYGIKLIETKTLIRQAFDLMNRTFAKNEKYPGWRLFQIVFIVSEIQDIAYSEYKNSPIYQTESIDQVDLLYFPTGGGKTEAFFGCALFTAFFDRLRGKLSHTSVVIKYPLRLLSSQQLDRLLFLTLNANKTKEEFHVAGQPFSVGLFTGSGNTPNKITSEVASAFQTSDQDSIDEQNRQIDKCPICDSPVHVRFNRENWTLEHHCDCCGRLPVYIVDDDIYRYPPTFIISTIDKLANIGTSPGFKSLIGGAYGACSKHGNIFLPNQRCSVSGCGCTLTESHTKDPIPTLFIQDELHLVSESLGTFDSHYESFLQYYCENLAPADCRKKIKYIAATATISAYDAHCNNLYFKSGRCFPASVKGKNFYSYTDEDDVARIILGSAFYGGSITDRLQKAVTYLREIILDALAGRDASFFSDAAENGFIGDETALKEVLNDYLVTIIYNTSKNDASNVQAAIENQGANYLRSQSCPPFDIDEISGDRSFISVKNVMHSIESVHDKLDTKNLIIATSSISHGVDEDCFNQIFFYGMPDMTSEYIQAYSRVGRKYTGIVFDVIRLARDRDQSYLKNFDGFHRYKDLLIDPVPINRWAKNAIYATLPGIVSAWFIQCLGGDSRALTITKMIRGGQISLSQMQQTIENIYGCTNNPSANLYKKVIDEEVANIYQGFSSNTDGAILIGDLIAKHNSRQKHPMTSLRDVDVTLEIKLGG